MADRPVRGRVTLSMTILMSGPMRGHTRRCWIQLVHQVGPPDPVAHVVNSDSVPAPLRCGAAQGANWSRAPRKSVA